MHFICTQAHKLGVTPVITFDQPLWLKATMIAENEPADSPVRNVVLRLGGLHIEMTFLGCVGHLMGGSGLREILELFYAENAVGHILSGKAIARAVRAHLLVEATLTTMIMSTIMCVTNQPQENIESEKTAVPNEFNEAAALYEGLMNHTTTVQEGCAATCLKTITGKLAAEKESLKKHRTANLWFQYMAMVDILRKCIKAERTGDWKLHLKAVSDMLPYFAASGHNLYAKSAGQETAQRCNL